MKLTDRSIASFSMSLAHAIGMDESNIRGMHGLYALVLMSERERAEDPEVAKLTDLDEEWATWTGRKLAKLSSSDKQENMEKYAKKALTTIQDTKNYQHGLMMAVALKLIEAPHAGNEDA